jgi:hypothetical protein
MLWIRKLTAMFKLSLLFVLELSVYYSTLKGRWIMDNSKKQGWWILIQNYVEGLRIHWKTRVGWVYLTSLSIASDYSCQWRNGMGHCCKPEIVKGSMMGINAENKNFVISFCIPSPYWISFRMKYYLLSFPLFKCI